MAFLFDRLVFMDISGKIPKLMSKIKEQINHTKSDSRPKQCSFQCIKGRVTRIRKMGAKALSVK